MHRMPDLSPAVYFLLAFTYFSHFWMHDLISRKIRESNIPNLNLALQIPIVLQSVFGLGFGIGIGIRIVYFSSRRFEGLKY
jgi:hypothetical protein